MLLNLGVLVDDGCVPVAVSASRVATPSTITTVQKSVEVPQIQSVDRVHDAPASMQEQIP